MAERSVGRLSSEARDPSLEELRDRVSDRFRSVGATAGALQAKVRDSTDLRRVARRHPAWAIGAAAGAGLVVAAAIRRRRRRNAEQRVEAALGWLSRFPFGPQQQKRGLVGSGASLVRGTFGLLAGVLVRRFSRQLQEELLKSRLRPRPRLVAARPAP